MGKKQKTQFDPSSNDLALRALSNMKYQDLQKACIVKGMPFEDVCSKGAPALSQWFINNYDNCNNFLFLDEYDVWIEGELKKLGYKDGDAMLHPSLRFGFTKGYEESTTIKSDPTIKAIDKPKKAKKEKDESTGMFLGTKKALTRECAKEGLTLTETIEKVSSKFPEYNEKSIKIWYKKFTK